MIKRLLMTGLILMMNMGSLYAEDQADQQFEGFNLQGYTGEGEKAWNVDGDTADIMGSEIKIQNVDADTYGEQSMNLKAVTGVVDQVSGDMHLETDVTITSETGTKLITDTLDWRRNDDLVTTEDDVIISDPEKGLTITGTGMDAHPGLSTAQVNKDVTAMIEMDSEIEEKKEKDIITITCDGPMVIDRAKSKAIFNINVVAIQKDQTLKADKMEIYFNQEEAQMKELICTGNVVVVRGENETYAEKMVYDKATEKMTLSGRPKLILLTEGENAITAPGN